MATRMYLKLGDIVGTSKDEKHVDWIELESFNYGVVNSGRAVQKAKGDASGEACSHNDVSCSKASDPTTSLLFAYCSVGKLFPKAEIEIYEEKDPLFKITLEKVMISTVGMGGTSGSGVPTETFSLGFAKIEWKYRGEAPQHWDLLANKGSVEK